MQDVKNSEQSKYNKVTRLTVQKTVTSNRSRGVRRTGVVILYCFRISDHFLWKSDGTNGCSPGKKKNVFILLYNMQFVMDTDRIDCQRAL